jgi:P2-related tail formation protein
MSSVFRGTRLIENCTPSINYDRQIQAASDAFDRQMFEIIDETGQIVMIPNIMGLTDSKLVDILAWQFHVDFYDATKDLEFRKHLVQQAIVWHKRKGTLDLVQEILDTYWPGQCSITEWFTYKHPFPPNYPTAGWHERYKFRIYIDNALVVDPEIVNQIVALIGRYKPVSRWPETAISTPATAGTGRLYVFGWLQIGITFRSRPPEIR